MPGDPYCEIHGFTLCICKINRGGPHVSISNSSRILALEHEVVELREELDKLSSYLTTMFVKSSRPHK